MRVALITLAVALARTTIAPAQISEVVLHSFAPPPTGAAPYAGLTPDAAGNLYGATSAGGAQNAGAIYRIDSSHQLSILHSFTGGMDGSGPRGGVTVDSSGNLYGTTAFGGAAGAGVVYKLSTTGQLTVLYDFSGGADGSNPYAGVALGSAGALYGTTVYGGSANGYSGFGVVYKLTATGRFTLLYTFTGTADGAYPYAGVVEDSAGIVYGTTFSGGAFNAGVVYKVNGAHESIIYNFSGGADGANPYSGVIRDSAGNLFGATYAGGASGSGVVYKIGPAGREGVIHSFTGGADGGSPYGGVTRDSAGFYYGTTLYGGSSNAGVIFKLAPAGHETVLYNFTGGADGVFSYAGVVRDGQGNLYGATYSGGTAGLGVVYELSPAGQQTVLHSFTQSLGGYAPGSNLLLDLSGNLYGTAPRGGALGLGLVFRIDTHGHETVLHTFTGPDGSTPNSGLSADMSNNLYGVTFSGGGSGFGAVYKIDRSGNQTVLYSFKGGLDGSNPYANPIVDSAGNLYGTTWYGGTTGGGVIYKIDPTGVETVLYKFAGAPGAARSYSGLTRDAAGNLYGTEYAGGSSGCGIAYKLDPSNNFTVLYNLTYTGGCFPYAGVVIDTLGSLYGTTELGGSGNSGVIYKLDTTGKYTALYNFTGGADGEFPNGGLYQDANGNFYGTTNYGGATGLGVVYKLDTKQNLTVLYNFTGVPDAASPNAAVVLDAQGGLYGTTLAGGTGNVGTVFKLKGVQ